MLKLVQIRKIALSFPQTTEEPHFEKTSFRINKKIFATFDEKNERLCVKFSLIDQDLFSLPDKSSIYPVPNKWANQGWTFVEIQKINLKLLKEILKCAYGEVAPKKQAKKIKSSNK